MSLTFSMDSAPDALNDLRHKIGNFRQDALNESLAMDCAIAAWSLCDWVFRHHGEQLGFASLRDLQRHVKDECPEAGLLQDLANARKHGGGPTHYTPRLKRARKHGGSFSQSFSKSFNTSRLYLVFDDNQNTRMDDTLEAVLSYWEDFFARHGLIR